jgi:pyruvate/2-oxoacid:ferredoxin oxidoreductase alpha subunit
MSNAMRKIEELTQLWKTQAESYKEQEEAVLMVPLGTAAAATVNACVRELEEILNEN